MEDPIRSVVLILVAVNFEEIAMDLERQKKMTCNFFILSIPLCRWLHKIAFHILSDTVIIYFFYVLLTVALSITLVINQLNAQNLVI